MKLDDYSRSIVLITSGNPENTHFATGFIIHHDSATRCAYVVTCAHIFSDIHWQADMRIDGHGRGDFISDRNLDLAIMQVNGLSDRPRIKLGDYGRIGSPFITTGFSVYGKHYSLQNIEGVLEKNIELVSSSLLTKGARTIHGLDIRVPAWNVKILGETSLQGGFSGAPLIDKESGVCIGVMSYRQGDGRSGLAISIESLSVLLSGIGISPDIIERLLDSEKKRESHLDIIFHKAIRSQIMGDLQDSLELFQQIKNSNPTYPRIDMMINSVEKEMHQKYVINGIVRAERVMARQKAERETVSTRPVESARPPSPLLLPIGCVFILIVLGILAGLGYFLLRWWLGW